MTPPTTAWHDRIRVLVVLVLFAIPTKAWNLQFDATRRRWLQQGGSAVVAVLASLSAPSKAADRFISAGTTRAEYTNSITASRDTNISPKEVYDTLARVRGSGTLALDVGSGAGVSTQVLWDMGYTNIDACDWSRDAWDLNVVEKGSCPESVHFFQLDDERFMRQWKASEAEKYGMSGKCVHQSVMLYANIFFSRTLPDAIVFNFAINQQKALEFASELLNKDGVLLAPVNVQQDYWLKQRYDLMDSDGKVLWSAADVGAWSVQFQPDVTQETCQGIWCPPYNGFRKQQ